MADGDELDIGNEVLLEWVDKFCCVGDMLLANGGHNLAMTTRMRTTPPPHHNCSTALFPGPSGLWVSQSQKRTSGLYGARED